MLYKNVIGTLIESYYICKRQVWFIGHSIYADQSNPYIELGRLIDQSTYKNEKKQIHFENVVIDIVSRKEGEVIVGEIKKSSKAIKSATMQLAFYLKKLKDCGINLNGELLIPKEKKRIEIILTKEMENELEQIEKEIIEIVNLPLPPKLEKIKYCKKCGYLEFCLA